MPEIVQVAIHSSQFPAQVRRDLLESLRTRRVNHKFHYDSVKQTQKWLALHEAYSPARTDADCVATYEAAFASVAKRIAGESVQVIGLGCGGGQKDTRLLNHLREPGKEVWYIPSDVSVSMTLVARAAALSAVSPNVCYPFVCDLATADDLDRALGKYSHWAAARLITFFGMIPNFEPQIILPRLAALVRTNDHLLFSANLAPGPDYAAGVRRVLPLYDNDLTRDWLMTFLRDLGVEDADGKLRFDMEDDSSGSGLKRIVAHFHFSQPRNIRVDDETFEFRAGENIRLFFSYRHTPALVRAMLEPQGLKVVDQWITKSEEEGVFLCRRG
jgi:uncharacterized SAM-dependent methyltransferase